MFRWLMWWKKEDPLAHLQSLLEDETAKRKEAEEALERFNDRRRWILPTHANITGVTSDFKVMQIKAIHYLTRLGLKESKEMVDDLLENGNNIYIDLSSDEKDRQDQLESLTKADFDFTIESGRAPRPYTEGELQNCFCAYPGTIADRVAKYNNSIVCYECDEPILTALEYDGTCGGCGEEIIDPDKLKDIIKQVIKEKEVCQQLE